MVSPFHAIVYHHTIYIFMSVNTTATSPHVLYTNIVCGVGGCTCTDEGFAASLVDVDVGGCTCTGEGFKASLVDLSLARSMAVLPLCNNQVNTSPIHIKIRITKYS